MTADNNDRLKEYITAELGIIQDIIKRLDSHQFMIKGWAITLVVVSLLLKGNEYQVGIAFIPLLVFWFLDAHFLWLERMYRKLYDWVIDHRLLTDELLFNMDAKNRFKHEVDSRLNIMFSVTLGWFYGTIGILVIIYCVVLALTTKGGS